VSPIVGRTSANFQLQLVQRVGVSFLVFLDYFLICRARIEINGRASTFGNLFDMDARIVRITRALFAMRSIFAASGFPICPRNIGNIHFKSKECVELVGWLYRDGCVC